MAIQKKSIERALLSPENLFKKKWEDLKKLLRHGDRAAIARILKYSDPYSITRILQHKRSNTAVFTELSKILINRYCPTPPHKKKP